MLLDSGHLQEQDAAYVNKQKARRKEPLIEPLYTQRDAQKCLDQFVGVSLHRRISVADGVDLTFHEAGHILGAAFVCLEIREHSSSKQWRLIFSGDLGREEVSILHVPEAPAAADIVLMESTYGDRQHGSYASAQDTLRDIVNTTARRQGKVIIPAFAVGRTQEIVYALNKLDAEGDIAPVPVFVDSPLAVNNQEVQQFLTEDGRRSLFDYKRVTYIRDVSESKRLNYLSTPEIIIAASGMAEGGRVLHHLKNNIEDPDNTVLIVSFQAENTLGRRLKDGVTPVRIFGEPYDVRAQIVVIDGYSAHADQSELLHWAGALDRQRLQHLFLVHGEPKPAGVLAGELRRQGFPRVTIPQRGQAFHF
jgi:metallo-beta-lactamase family protein